MHHIHIDQFAGGSSPVHRMDPRAKFLTVLAFIFMVIMTPEGYFLSFFLYFSAVWSVVLLSKVPPLYIVKRSLTILPFAWAISMFVPFITPGPVLREFTFGDSFHVTVTVTGMIRFATLGMRSFLSFLAVFTLVSTTRFGDLMWSAGQLGLPSKLVVVLTFMYRYLFILIDETSHMLLARTLRGGRKRRIQHLYAAGGIVGSLWVRSFEHADRLYFAMLLRGHTGHPVALTEKHLGTRDIVFSAVFIAAAMLGLAAGRFYHV